MLTSPLILIIDDEPAILKTLKDALVDESFRAETLSDGKKAIAAIGKLVPDLVLLDICMPDCNGLEILKTIVEEFPQQKVVMISGFGTIQMATQALKQGAFDFIEKPLNLDEVLAKIEFLKAPSTSNSRPAVADYRDYGIIGKNNNFLEIMRQAELVAPLSEPILLYGAQGIGKSLLARFIHDKSNFKSQPFIALDCSTLPQDSFGSLLSEKFSIKQTLYLKNINALSFAGQKFLAALLALPAEARMIASSHESLFHRLQDGSFNPSLFSKLHSLPLEIPSLKKRIGDLPLLIDHYLHTANKLLDKSVSLSTQALRLLVNRPWRGNITELKNTLYHLVLMSTTATQCVAVVDMIHIFGEREIQFVEEQQFMQFGSFNEAITTFEKNFLLYLLKKNHYNIEQVACQLSLPPTELQNKINELNLQR